MEPVAKMNIVCWFCLFFTAVSAQDNLDSYWGEWQPWSACSNDCGIGERERIRPCEGAGECDYSCDNCGDYEKEDCLNDNPCPEWTPWRPVSPCTVTCGWGYRGMERTCDGVGCVGESQKMERCWVECESCENKIEDADCELYSIWCIAAPGFMQQMCKKTCNSCDLNCSCQTRWSSWTPCTKSCGGGLKYRRRNCSNVEESCGLSNNISTICNTQECRVWSACSRTCGWGTRSRKRICPPNDPLTCIKTKFEYEDCKLKNCPPRDEYVLEMDQLLVISILREESCPRNMVHRYGTNTECCALDRESCGSFFGSGNDIIGGVEADRRSWPWMVKLRLGNPKGGSFAYCAASLIHSRWALTATHCVLTFRGPQEILAISGQVRYVHRVHMHPGFSNWLENDISLLEFREPFEFNPGTNIAPVCLPWNEETPIDTQCYAAGWGATDPNLIELSETLQEVNLRYLDMDACRFAYDQPPSDPFRIPNADKLNETRMICAGRMRGGADTCVGDSGGPLMCQRCSTCSWYIAGITSYGTENCGAVGRPGVYTKVLAYEQWIRDTTNGDILQIRNFKGSCSLTTLQ